MLPKTKSTQNLKKKFVQSHTFIDITSINEFILNIFENSQDISLKLANICYNQTDGNYFLIFQYISHLITQGAMYEDARTHKWQIDYDILRTAGVSELVAQHYLKKLIFDSIDFKKFQTAASMMGIQFPTELLQKSLDFSDSKFKEVLQLSKNYHIFLILNRSEGKEKILRFSHKIIQEKCSQYIFEIDEYEFFYQILYVISDHLSFANESIKYFEIFKLINQKFIVQMNVTQKKLYVSLNLKFANHAVLNEKLGLAIELLESTLSVIPSKFWIKNRESMFEISILLISFYYKARRFKDGEKIIRGLFTQSKLESEKAQLYYYSVIFASIQRKSKIVWELSRKAMADLELFKTPLPKFTKVSEFRDYFTRRLIKLRNSLEKKKQIIRDSRGEYALKILAAAAPQIMLNRERANLFYLEMIELIEYFGVNEEAPSILYLLSGNLIGEEKTHKLGLWFINKAENLAKKYNRTEFSPLVELVYANQIIPWTSHIRNSEVHNTHAVNAGIIGEDLEIAAYSLTFEELNKFSAGTNLNRLMDEIPQIISKQQDLFPGVFSENLLGLFMILSNLTERTTTKENFNSILINYTTFMELSNKRNRAIPAIGFRILRGILETFYKDYLSAFRTFNSVKSELNLFRKRIIYADFIFYYTIVLIKILMNYGEKQLLGQRIDKNQVIEIIEKNLKLYSQWVDFSPQNFKSRWYILNAIYNVYSEAYESAINYFNMGILSAQKNQFIQIEALGNELMAELFLIHNYEHFTGIYYQKALELYRKWGAKRKVALLCTDNQWHQIFSSLGLNFSSKDKEFSGFNRNILENIKGNRFSCLSLQIHEFSSLWLLEIFQSFQILAININSVKVLSINPTSGEKISKLVISIQKMEKKHTEINSILSWLNQKPSIISADIYIDSKKTMIKIITNCNLITHIAQNLDIEIKYPIICSKDFQKWQLICTHQKMRILTRHFSKKKIHFSIISVIPQKKGKQKSSLTPRQLQIYNLAVEMGYFEYPRRISLSQLALVAEVSTSTISVMMRRILAKNIK